MLKQWVLWVGGALCIVGIGFGIAYLTGVRSVERQATIDAPSNYILDMSLLAEAGGTVPTLTGDVHFGKTVNATDQSKFQAKIDAVRARLASDNTRADDWFSLAILYLDAGDTESARVVWEFLLAVVPAPNSAVVYSNLGKLYEYQLKDFKKAETYFREAMVADPTLEEPYASLFELYRYSYKQNTTAAVEVMQLAIEKFPKNLGFQLALAEYYRDAGRTAEARAVYTTALAAARTVGNLQVVSTINAELAKLQ